MRRWFVILLAVLLSVQFGWAAAATYCTHEASDAALSHFGHHAGTHADTPSKSVDPAEAQKMQKAQSGQKSVAGDQTRLADLDHGHCHLAQAAVGHDADLRVEINNERGAHHGGEPLRTSHIPDGLDRPDWLRA